MKKYILSLAFVALAFIGNAQTVITLTATAENDQNGSQRAVTTKTIVISTGNISHFSPSGSGAVIYLKTPVRAGSTTITGYSVTSTPDAISVLANGNQPGTQTLTGAGAVNLTQYNTVLVTTGANALTLAAGTEGQYKFIRMKTDGGDGTLTVTNFQGGTTITFNDAGDFVLLYYLDSKWHIIVNSGCTVA